jgi:hypothetical protein
MTVLTLATKVRLPLPSRVSWPDIGTATGTVTDVGQGWVEVAWPRHRSWHRDRDVEVVA